MLKHTETIKVVRWATLLGKCFRSCETVEFKGGEAVFTAFQSMSAQRVESE
jgi:hypothetical protein